MVTYLLNAINNDTGTVILVILFLIYLIWPITDIFKLTLEEILQAKINSVKDYIDEIRQLIQNEISFLEFKKDFIKKSIVAKEFVPTMEKIDEMLAKLYTHNDMLVMYKADIGMYETMNMRNIPISTLWNIDGNVSNVKKKVKGINKNIKSTNKEVLKMLDKINKEMINKKLRIIIERYSTITMGLEFKNDESYVKQIVSKMSEN